VCEPLSDSIVYCLSIPDCIARVVCAHLSGLALGIHKVNVGAKPKLK